MTINARHCYTELAEAIEQACRERHYYIVTERAEALGLPGGGEGSGFSEKHAYSATDENGLMVVSVRSSPPCWRGDAHATGAALWQALVRHHGYANYRDESD